MTRTELAQATGTPVGSAVPQYLLVQYSGMHMEEYCAGCAQHYPERVIQIRLALPLDGVNTCCECGKIMEWRKLV